LPVIGVGIIGWKPMPRRSEQQEQRTEDAATGMQRALVSRPKWLNESVRAAGGQERRARKIPALATVNGKSERFVRKLEERSNTAPSESLG
jgi:hypothetical protein